MTKYVLAIDQGTTSTRSILFDREYHIAAQAQQEFAQHFPQSGWVEHDPDDIWQGTLTTSRAAIASAGAAPEDIAAIGITNQRETTLVWDRETGQPIHRAIVWQDRRTQPHCSTLKADGHENTVSEKTGLLLDPYFSATKITWLLDNVAGARERAQAGQLAFGTVDTYLLWRLTGGRIHATDATNASRTMLYNISEGRWDEELCDLFNVPTTMLPAVHDNAAEFGTTDPDIFGKAIAITGVAGDQQAATVGQACFQPGMLKATYGTGCFALLNTGSAVVRSRNRLLTTIAYQLDGKPTYALEGSIFIAGAAVQWLRDGLKIISEASESGRLAPTADDGQDVYLVPAFVGLGAPYWDSDCRGAVFGLTRNSGPAELSRAALESVSYQTRDLVEAMRQDWTADRETVLRVDAGMVAPDGTMQRLSDLLAAPVDRPHTLETTALGAAYLAGLQVGFYPEPEIFAQHWSRERRFEPQLPEAERERKYAGWRDAVSRTLSR